MKKLSWFFSLITFVLVLFLTACNNGKAIDVGEDVYEARYQVFAASESNTNNEIKLEASFYDDYYDYYAFYLGYVTGVPLQDPASVMHYHYTGDYDMEHTFTSTKTTESSVESSCKKAVSNTVKIGSSSSVESKLGTEIKVEVGAEAGVEGMKASVKEGFSLENSLTTGLSNSFSEDSDKTFEDSYKKVSSESEKIEEKRTFKFTAGEAKPGYYKYLLTGTVKVYLIYIIDREDSTKFYSTNVTTVESFGYGLEYSENSLFEQSSYDQFQFNQNKLLNLEKPTLKIETNVQDNKEMIGTGTAEDPYLIKTVNDLVDIDNFADDERKFSHFKLLNDLSLKGVNVNIAEFYGVFDGNNYTISDYNYSIPQTKFTEVKSFGLFSKNYGTIKNLKIKNFRIKADVMHEGESVNVGFVAGYNEGLIQNVHVGAGDLNNSSCLLEIHRGVSASGGITGYNVGELKNVTVKYARFYINGDCGGICGINIGSIENASFEGEAINGSVKENPDNVSFMHPVVFSKSIGGIVGYNKINANIINVSVSNMNFYCRYGGSPKAGYVIGDNEGNCYGSCLVENCDYYIESASLGNMFKVLNGKIGVQRNSAFNEWS